MAVIRLANIAVALVGRLVLRDVTASVQEGQQVLLTGANGAGKTTLLRLLATALRPRRGLYTLFGGHSRAHHMSARPRLSLMTHQHHFYEPLTAAQNLQLIGALSGHTSALAQRRVLEQVGLEGAKNRPVAGFSAGMKRRLALARITLLAPELVLLDEPFGQLDEAGVRLMHETLVALKQRGATVVMATHDIDRGKAHCSRQWHLCGGKIVDSDLAQDAGLQEPP